ncbi:MFS transporter [Microbispora rosea]|uniref:MFS transporter n=1 Tax=Microbispora rosea TaxID=58117 RepID=UPI0036854C9B
MSGQPGGLVRAAVAWAARWLTGAVGGPARFQIIAVLACVLALDAADKGTVGAVAVELKESLGISNTELGSLTAVSSASAALAVIPVGVLTDRVRRVRLLTAGVMLWVLAMLAGGLADSYQWLLLSRLALGAVSATAGPTLSSLIGDFFPPGERARVYGFILSGEMLGVGFGLLVGGNLAHLLSWRAAFFLLALFGTLLTFVIARKLPEPARGGQGRRVPRRRQSPAGRRAPRRRPLPALGTRGKHTYVPTDGRGGGRPRDLRIPGRPPRLGRRRGRAGPAVRISDHARSPGGERDHPAPRQALLPSRRRHGDRLREASRAVTRPGGRAGIPPGTAGLLTLGE